MPLGSLVVRGLYCSRVDMKPETLGYCSLNSTLAKFICLSVSGHPRVSRLSLSDNESFDFLACTHTLPSELLLSFTTSGNVMDSEATNLRFSLNAGSLVALVLNLCASPVSALLLSWFVALCIT